MAQAQAMAMQGGMKTAQKHFIAVMKELEYHVGFRFEVLPKDAPDDPRKG